MCQTRGPQFFWHQGLVQWKTIFSRIGEWVEQEMDSHTLTTHLLLCVRIPKRTKTSTGLREAFGDPWFRTITFIINIDMFEVGSFYYLTHVFHSSIFSCGLFEHLIYFQFIYSSFDFFEIFIFYKNNKIQTLLYRSLFRINILPLQFEWKEVLPNMLLSIIPLNVHELNAPIKDIRQLKA